MTTEKKSFIWDALFVLLLSILGPIGLLASISSFREAKRAEKAAGRSLPGVGCLSVLYWIHISIAVLEVGGLAMFAALVACSALITEPSPSAYSLPSPLPAPVYVPSTPLPADVYASPTLPISTPEPVRAWVCVDLAYGYARPDTTSPVIFQMSQRDGWSVWVYELKGRWYTVGNGNAPAYMEYETLCKDQPRWRETDSAALNAAHDALQKMLDRNHGQ